MYDCAVVGGGAAGLLAAVTLSEAGREVILLEARDYLGGRAHSVPLSDGTVVEHGAQFVHGPTVATWELISQYRLTTRQALMGKDRPYAVYSDGKWSKCDPVIDAAWAMVEEVLSVPNSDEISLKDALVATGAPTPILKAAEAMMSVSVPMSPDRVSARTASDIFHAYDTVADPISGVTRPGNPNFLLVDGYSRLWGELSRHIQDAICLSTPVTTIDWSRSDNVVIKTTGSEFEARNVIISVPIGVLQSGTIQFHPKLPESKTEAISDINPGALIKVVAEFRSRWWEPSLGKVGAFQNSEPSMFQLGFWDPYFKREGPPALLSFIGTPFAEEVTGDSSSISDNFLGALRQLFTDVDLDSELVSLHVADWASDPWTMGGISVVPIGKYQARSDLAAPTPPLFWAGEATHNHGHAETVHGALETGRRAAFEVLHTVAPSTEPTSSTPIDWWQYVPRMAHPSSQ